MLKLQLYKTYGEKETAELAQSVCKKIKPGSIVLFTGEMGAGKTAFVRGALRAYDNDSFVSSPTFALVNDYGGDPHIYHFDMYRVTDGNDLYSTGFYDYVSDNSILFVEWSENVRDYIEADFASHVIYIDIQKTDRENERVICVKGGLFS